MCPSNTEVAAIPERAIELIASALSLDESDIREESHFMDDLGTDEMDMMRVFSALEDEYGVEVSDDEAEVLETVEDVINHIQDNVQVDDEELVTLDGVDDMDD